MKTRKIIVFFVLFGLTIGVITIGYNYRQVLNFINIGVSTAVDSQNKDFSKHKKKTEEKFKKKIEERKLNAPKLRKDLNETQVKKVDSQVTIWMEKLGQTNYSIKEMPEIQNPFFEFISKNESVLKDKDVYKLTKLYLENFSRKANATLGLTENSSSYYRRILIISGSSAYRNCSRKKWQIKNVWEDIRKHTKKYINNYPQEIGGRPAWRIYKMAYKQSHILSKKTAKKLLEKCIIECKKLRQTENRSKQIQRNGEGVVFDKCSEELLKFKKKP